SLAFQPITKFAAEMEKSGPYISAGLIMILVYYAVISGLTLLAKPWIVPLLDRAGQTNLPVLLNYLPLLFIASFYRSFAVSLLQAKYELQRIFWIEASYFLGVLVIVAVSGLLGLFSTAQDLMIINLLGFGCSTVIALVMTARAVFPVLEFDLVSFKRIWNFGKFTFLGNVMYSVFSQFDVFFVSSYAGVFVVAGYNAAKITLRIFDIVSQVIQMFLIPFSSKAYAREDMKTLTVTAEKIICFSLVGLLPVFIVMFFFPEQLLHVLYRGKYDQAASVVRILSFFSIIVAWNAVIASYLVGTGKVKEGFYSGVLLVVIATPLYFILTAAYGAVGAAISLVGSQLLVTLALVYYARSFISLKIWNI